MIDSNKVTVTVEPPKPPNPCTSFNDAQWDITITPQIVKEGDTATATFNFPDPNTSYCYNLYGLSKGTCSVSNGCSASVTFTAQGTGLHYATVGNIMNTFYFWKVQTGWYSYSTPLPFSVVINGNTYYRFYPEIADIGSLCSQGQLQCGTGSPYTLVDIQNGRVYLQLPMLPDPTDSNKIWLEINSVNVLGYFYDNQPVSITP